MVEGTTDPIAQNNTEAVQGQSVEQENQANEPAQVEGKTILTDAETAKVEGAPEAYADFTVPEGLELDGEMLGKFTDMAKGIDLSQANAQKLVDLVSDHTKNMVQKEELAFSKVREEWITNLKRDPDFGGDKFGETIERAKRTVSKFGSNELLGFLDDTGYGDNAELLKLFARVDRVLGEDKIVDGEPSGTSHKTAAQVMYPDHGKK